MERESFTFYRSYYEAIKCHPREVQFEIYSAIMEYALDGKIPDHPKPITATVFALVRPMLDANTARYVNGRKGGRKPSAPTAAKAPAPILAPADVSPRVTAGSFEEEIASMKSDDIWIKSVMARLKLTRDQFDEHLESFLAHCKKSREGKLHDDLTDAKRHFGYWMRKRSEVPAPNAPQSSSSSYAYNGGFGGMDT